MPVSTTRNYLDLPRVHRSDGAVRRVGLELEFTGLSLEVAAQAVEQHVVATWLREAEWLYRDPLDIDGHALTIHSAHSSASCCREDICADSIALGTTTRCRRNS